MNVKIYLNNAVIKVDKRIMVAIFKGCRRTLKAKDKLNVLFATYHSLTDFSRKRVGPCAVARQVKLSPSTVTRLLQLFEMHDFDVGRFLPRRKPPGRPRKVIGSPEIERELLSTDCLTKWAHLTILKRCEKIWREYRVRVGRHKLTLFYQRNNIRCKTARAKYYPHGKNLQLLEARRIEFAMRMTEYIFEGQPIIYCDETSFRGDRPQKKAWFYKDRRFEVPVPKGTVRGFSVYGAVGECIRGNCFYSEVHDSTNAADFTGFIRNLATQLVPAPNGVKPVIVLDNHSAHKGPDRVELMEQFFRIEYIPVYSSPLNGPIESVWSVLKPKCLSKFTKIMLRKQSTRAACIQAVEKEIQAIGRQTFVNLLRAHYNDLGELIEKIDTDYIYPLPYDGNNND